MCHSHIDVSLSPPFHSLWEGEKVSSLLRGSVHVRTCLQYTARYFITLLQPSLPACAVSRSALKVSRVRVQGHLKSFLIVHKGLCMPVAFMIPRSMLELSKPSMGIFFSFTFKVFWLVCCLPQLLHLLSTASGSRTVQQLSLIVFDRRLPPGKRLFNLAALSNKDSLMSGVFQGTTMEIH